MRRLLLVAAAFPVLALTSASAPAGVASVSVSESGFDPQTISVHRGDTVTWTNTGDHEHQITSAKAEFPSSPVLRPGQSWSFTFARQGRFAYIDGVNQNVTATVVVMPPAPSVTIGSARDSAVYGGAGITLTGRVSSHRAGEHVQVVARACGTFGSSQDEVVTSRNGTWRLVVHPILTTAFGAIWNRVASPAFHVNVAPRVTLRRRPTRLTVAVAAATTLATRTMVLQRFGTAHRKWTTVAHARLHAAGRTPSGTFFSTTAFGRRSGRVRAMLTSGQARPCYSQSISNVVRG